MKASQKNKQATSNFKLSVFSATAIIAVGILAIAAWVEIQASNAGPLPSESNFHSPFFLPFVLTGGALLFACGVTLIVRAIKQLKTDKRSAILTLALALIFMAPGTYYGYTAVSPFIAKAFADRIISNEEALKEVQECKAESIRLEADPSNNKEMARIYHQTHSETAGIKSNYDYRSFKPEYFDELFKVARSKEVRERCGPIKIHDLSRYDIPPTFTWVNLEEAKEAIDTCSIENVLTKLTPRDRDIAKVSNPASRTGALLHLMPTPEGYSGSLYIVGADASLRSAILDYTAQKQGSCPFDTPSVSDQN
jgi:hypothetical protein